MWLKAHPYSLFISIALTLSCSQPGPVGMGANSPEMTSSVSLFGSYEDAVRGANVSADREQSTLDVYREVLAAASDKPLAIQDMKLSWGNLRSELAANADVFTRLASEYPTVGELADAGLLSAPKGPSLVDFQSWLRTLSTANTGDSLALVFASTFSYPNGRTIESQVGAPPQLLTKSTYKTNGDVHHCATAQRGQLISVKRAGFTYSLQEPGWKGLYNTKPNLVTLNAEQLRDLASEMRESWKTAAANPSCDGAEEIGEIGEIGDDVYQGD